MRVPPRFPGSAHRGIEKLYYAFLLILVVNALMILAVVMALLAKDVQTVRAAQLFVLIAGYVGFAVLVLELVGVCQACRDEALFKTARNLIVVGLLLNALAYFTDSGWIDFAGDIADFIGRLFILKGIMHLSSVLNRSDMYDRGKRLYRLTMIVECGAFGVTVLAEIMKIGASPAEEIAILLLSLVCLVLRIVELVQWVGYLSRAAKMMDFLPTQPSYDDTSFPPL